MSLVPSEIDHQDDSSDPDRAAMRISGFTISVMMSMLAAGFAVVGFFAFQQLPGGAPAHATAPPALLEDDKIAAVEVDKTTQNGSEGAEGAVVSSAEAQRQEDAASARDEADDMRVADVDPVPGEPLTPTIKPQNRSTPTVMIDPTIIDAEPSTPDTSSDERTVETGNAADDAQQVRRVEARPLANETTVEASEPEPSDPQPAADTGAAREPVTPESRLVSNAPIDDVAAPQTQSSATPIDALAGSHVVQVGSFRSEAEAMADWSRMQTQFDDLLAGKTFDIQTADLGERGVYYRLRVGPFAGNDNAQAYCRTLTARGKACLAVRH